VVNLYRPANPVVATIHRNDLCTASRKSADFVKHTQIDVSGTDLPGNVQPGQSIGIVPPGLDPSGRPHKLRLYSVASPSSGEDANPNIIATTVKRLIDEHREDRSLFLGVCSNHLCDLAPGAPVIVTGPVGKRFLLPKDLDAHDYTFFATGTGIAPFRAMILELIEAKARSSITLIAGAAYATDLLYHDLFLSLQLRHPNFSYLTAVSRETQADGHDRLYVQDRILTNRDELAPRFASERNLIYVCGITGMEVGVFRNLATTLGPQALEQYLDVPRALLDDTDAWSGRRLHPQIRPTRRVLLEVYD
jgi:ferredoxin--NADP+ reductase